MSYQDDMQSLERTAQLFKVLGDQTRLKILYLLSKRGSLKVEDIIYELGMEQSAVSHQLSKLRKNHIVKGQKMGKYVVYQMVDEHVRHMFELALAHSQEEE
ncbi:ArsR/SmtB family transcription factor [Streptococcus gallinaceus]|uniref:ArsR family transcriptional regulator n=1 Tax=Streptococcus gallinaceus TaxID=165758 RepID=A0ABV2JKX2_9STRE|nr:metalloregulator ArsR/SmtB family transcription factor [Streptococcus gallinaceus]MCP1639816.1 ArsR family transcriptional regulator [Streptococcus gallinaceus]MCP1770598.1 ArsR family transcriptional regulator [Streptococcus gallinaceus]CRH94686.1 Cadmium efflux system accessory protein [Chlamydia trachomatis]